MKKLKKSIGQIFMIFIFGYVFLEWKIFQKIVSWIEPQSVTWNSYK